MLEELAFSRIAIYAVDHVVCNVFGVESDLYIPNLVPSTRIRF